MLFPRVKEPFFRFMVHAGLGGVGGVVLAIVLPLIAGVVMLIVSRIAGEVFAGADILSLMMSSIPLGALLGTVLGAVYGIVRKGE